MLRQHAEKFDRTVFSYRVLQFLGSVAPSSCANDLLAGARNLLDAGTEYYTSVQTIIPLAYLSEALFTTFYNRLVWREPRPPEDG